MIYLARKIKLSRWESGPSTAPDEVGAEVTACLRTPGNGLSLWLCQTADDADVRDAALALAATFSHIEPMDMVLLTDDDLVAQGFALTPTRGETPVHDLIDRHRDIENLTLARLVPIARLIARQVRERQETHCRTFQRHEVVAILRDAVRANRVAVDRLSRNVAHEVRQAL